MDTAYITFVECPIGVNDPENAPAFRIYPNPASRILLVEPLITIPETYSVEVLNPAGMVLIAQPGNIGKVQIELNGIAGGVYLLKISLSGREYYYRFIRI
jgi:hypothetical protein